MNAGALSRAFLSSAVGASCSRLGNCRGRSWRYVGCPSIGWLLVLVPTTAHSRDLVTMCSHELGFSPQVWEQIPETNTMTKAIARQELVWKSLHEGLVGPAAGASAPCPQCGSGAGQWRGYRVQKLEIVRRRWCTGCKKWFIGARHPSYLSNFVGSFERNA